MSPPSKDPPAPLVTSTQTIPQATVAQTYADSLAFLTPDHGQDLHSLFLKASSKPMGSFLNPLRKPSRLIETTRLYSPGDPLQAIDWRAFARTDQLLIRQVRDESTVKVTIGLDLSESMQWPPENADYPALPHRIPKKSEIALRIGLFLCSMHLKMGDEVKMWVMFKDRDLLPKALLQPKSNAEIRQLFLELESIKFSDKQFSNIFQSNHLDQTPSDLAYWVGDALGAADFQQFLKLGRKQLMVQLLSSLEKDISWVSGNTAYFDENTIKKEYQGTFLKENQRYHTELEQWLAKTKKSVEKFGGSYLFVTNTTPIDLFANMILDSFNGLRPSSNFGGS